MNTRRGEADLPLIRFIWVSVADAAIDDLNRRQQGVQAAGEDGLARSSAACDGDSAELVVHGSQEQRLLDVVHADDGC